MEQDKLIREAAQRQKPYSFHDLHLHLPFIDPTPAYHKFEDDKKSVSITIRVPINIKHELDIISKEYEITTTRMIINVIRDALVKHKDRQEARRLHDDYFKKSVAEI